MIRFTAGLRKLYLVLSILVEVSIPTRTLTCAWQRRERHGPLEFVVRPPFAAEFPHVHMHDVMTAQPRQQLQILLLLLLLLLHQAYSE